ncbi:hypothetical protein CAEBREN_10903 [Caenorhabditis brenneri]|uniref:Uncharacterized protein n=1 Tax=Caenorhabditis brenneri TaxID=135651 RepID=G0MMK0_CAEBE|nr:hypothetical protein CAEBREN_10903 [Caenorhabditis brenneri]
MTSDPIRYDSLKCLLQYIEFGKRIQLFKRCPAIRTAERSAPLRIESLVFENQQLRIDYKNYVIGIYQKCLHGETPRMIQNTNKWGGDEYEIDEYGIRNFNDNSNMTPGDVRIKGELEGPDIPIERRIAGHQRRVLDYERGLACQREGKPNRVADRYSERVILEELDKCRAKLLSYQSFRDNGAPLYENFVQFTIETETGDPGHIERYRKNDKKYHEAMKMLAIVLFGGRRCPVQVTYFRVTANVLRLPLGVKFQVNNLSFEEPIGPTILSMSSIIDSSSFPLKCLDVEAFKLEDAVHPVVRNAEKLCIGGYKIRQNLLLQILLSLENIIVHLTNEDFTRQNLILLIRNWIETGRPVGTHYKTDCRNKEEAKHRMKLIGNEFHVEIKEWVATIPMSDSRQLVIKCDEYPSEYYWSIEMEVQDVVKQE